MAHWKQILRRSITSYEELCRSFPGQIDPATAAVIERYPLRINPYYLDLIRKSGAPLYLQAVPSPRELTDHAGIADPLAEEALSPVPGIVHKYPDRVLFLVSSQCALYCRFCTRKRHVGRSSMPGGGSAIAAGLDYLRNHSEIKEVIVSGGDPLLLDDDRLAELLGALRAIPSLEIIRIGSRVPCTLPMRITKNLCRILKNHHPLFINTHFNHPAELTPEAELACSRLANAGIPLGCQTVLLKGVNDSSTTLRSLLRGLLRLRVKPYCLFQADLTSGTDHFRTTTSEGKAIMRELIGYISGMAVPTYTLDAPGGGGKIPLTPDYQLANDAFFQFRSYQGELCSYPEPDRPVTHFSS
jgi:lysine 2,3-aminomutase